MLFSCSVASDSLWPHGLEHAGLPCPSPPPGVWSDSCPLSWWCHPSISSSLVPVSSCLQSFLASGSFLMRQFFTSGGQSIGASTSVSVLPMNIQGWFLLGLTGLISLQSRGLSRVWDVKGTQMYGPSKINSNFISFSIQIVFTLKLLWHHFQTSPLDKLFYPSLWTLPSLSTFYYDLTSLLGGKNASFF